jgi:photosystem II stability/assembly factor-like uncharacterized protein
VIQLEVEKNPTLDFFYFVLYNRKMKKGVAIMSCFLAGLVFSGCSLVSKNPSPEGALKYPLSRGISISKDAGMTWEDAVVATTKPRIADINPLSLAMDPKNENIVYAGLRSGGIIKTTDGGKSWEFLTFKTEKVYGLAIDPIDSSTIYASTVVQGRGKIFKNSSSGANDSWIEIYTAATNGPLIISMALDNKNSKIIFAATSDNQVLKSVDGGGSWRNVFNVKSPIIKISLDAKESRLLYLLAKNGEVFSSFDGGNKFESLTKKITVTGLFGSGFSVLETDPTNGRRVYLAGKNGIIRSNDAGEKWESVVVLNNPENSPVGALAINPRNSQEIIYGASQATYKSIDEGKTWATSQFDLPKVINILKYNPQNPSIVYAGFVGK